MKHSLRRKGDTARVVSSVTPRRNVRARSDRQADGQWMFRSYDDLHHDLVGWLPRLPRLVGVCGVPRSGVIVASQLATLLNVPLLSIESLAASEVVSWRPSTSKPLPSPGGQRVLVVDDSCWSGGTIREVRRKLPESVRARCIFGAVYCNIESTSQLDCCGYTIDSIQHLFAWNYLRDMHARTTLTDMDGVLCDDWNGDENDENAAAYKNFLTHAVARVKPIYPVLGIVTGRVARHRAATQSWLDREGIKAHELVMPFADNESRRGRCVGTQKAIAYRDRHPTATLFVESDRQQAEMIFRQCGLPVLCTDTLELFQ